MTDIEKENTKRRPSNIGEQVGELLKYITDLEKEVEELKAHNKKMECCGNCKRCSVFNDIYCTESEEFLTFRNGKCGKCDKWELVE